MYGKHCNEFNFLDRRLFLLKKKSANKLRQHSVFSLFANKKKHTLNNYHCRYFAVTTYTGGCWRRVGRWNA
jgi:hypothetical protein